MAEGSKTDFAELALNGKNYLTWADDCQFHLEAMQLGKAIVRLSPNDIGLQLHEKTKAAIFLRRHIHPDLKMEYLEVKDPLVLWTKLRERFGVQKHVMLPRAQQEWATLRFLDFKTVEAYNTAIHRIVAQLRFCGQIVTDLEMIEKTLQTFHPSNMVLQQQYRNNKYTKYCELVNMLLGAEAQNELLMQNYQKRPVGAAAVPEAHANFPSQGKRGSSRGRGRGRRNNQGPTRGTFKKQSQNGSDSSSNNGRGRGRGKGKSNPQQGDVSASKHAGEGCFRCGSQQHWSRTCTTEKYLIDIYQEWKKRQNSEAHFIQAPVDATSGEHLELPQPSAQFEHAAINVDATTKSDTPLGKVDFDFDTDDLL
eukprot:XP_008646549.1 uncharacterized protein LOC103628043 [Zea mays]